MALLVYDVADAAFREASVGRCSSACQSAAAPHEAIQATTLGTAWVAVYSPRRIGSFGEGRHVGLLDRQTLRPYGGVSWWSEPWQFGPVQPDEPESQSISDNDFAMPHEKNVKSDEPARLGMSAWRRVKSEEPAWLGRLGLAGQRIVYRLRQRRRRDSRPIGGREGRSRIRQSWTKGTKVERSSGSG